MSMNSLPSMARAMSALPASKQSASGLPLSAKKDIQPRFGASPVIDAAKYPIRSPGKMMKLFDYQDFGKSIVNQVKIIYGLIIVSRMIAAAKRSWNELRETVARDVMGYTFWLFTVPMLERMVLYMMDSDYKKGLIQKRAIPQGSGFVNGLKKLNHSLNPMGHWETISASQIKDRSEMTLKQLEQQSFTKDSVQYKAVSTNFEKLLMKRRTVSAVGLVLTIGMLGIVIPMLNIAVTRKKLSNGQEGQQPFRTGMPLHANA